MRVLLRHNIFVLKHSPSCFQRRLFSILVWEHYSWVLVKTCRLYKYFCFSSSYMHYWFVFIFSSNAVVLSGEDSGKNDDGENFMKKYQSLISPLIFFAFVCASIFLTPQEQKQVFVFNSFSPYIGYYKYHCFSVPRYSFSAWDKFCCQRLFWSKLVCFGYSGFHCISLNSFFVNQYVLRQAVEKIFHHCSL